MFIHSFILWPAGSRLSMDMLNPETSQSCLLKGVRGNSSDLSILETELSFFVSLQACVSLRTKASHSYNLPLQPKVVS